MSVADTTTLRQRFPEIVVPVTQYNRTHLHAPDPKDPERPLCWEWRDGHGIRWQRKSVEVYPPGYREWCSTCLELLAEGDGND